MVLEVDSEFIISALNSFASSLASYGHLIVDAKSYVEFFRHIFYSHIRRQGNSNAHNLTRHAIHVIGSSVWMEDVFSHCFAVIQANMAFL